MRQALQSNARQVWKEAVVRGRGLLPRHPALMAEAVPERGCHSVSATAAAAPPVKQIILIEEGKSSPFVDSAVGAAAGPHSAQAGQPPVRSSIQSTRPVSDSGPCCLPSHPCSQVRCFAVASERKLRRRSHEAAPEPVGADALCRDALQGDAARLWDQQHDICLRPSPGVVGCRAGMRARVQGSRSNGCILGSHQSCWPAAVQKPPIRAAAAAQCQQMPSTGRASAPRAHRRAERDDRLYPKHARPRAARRAPQRHLQHASH